MTLRLLTACCVILAAGGVPAAGPWDLADLKKPPKVTWLDPQGGLRKLTYESEPRDGKPTRVFAYCAFPDDEAKRHPAMVLVHGGGGKAFEEWAKLWAKRGYVALAMDLAGNGPDGKRLADGGPGQDDASKFPRRPVSLKDVWSYHAVAAVIRGVSLLQSLPEVDPDRIGVTGISWGGYLTCIVAGLDDRLKVAVPVYGCGFLHENSAWLARFEKELPADWAKEWTSNFDPSRHVGGAKMPVLFVNGTNDFAYPLDSYQKTYRLVKDRQLCVTVRMPHGHPQGWAPKEIGAFVDQHINGGKPLPRLGEMKVSGGGVEAAVVSESKLAKAGLHYTTDGTTTWNKREWKSADATVKDGKVVAELPAGRPLVFFLTVTDERGLTVSTEHRVIEK